MKNKTAHNVREVMIIRKPSYHHVSEKCSAELEVGLVSNDMERSRSGWLLGQETRVAACTFVRISATFMIAKDKHRIGLLR